MPISIRLLRKKQLTVNKYEEALNGKTAELYDILV